MWLVHAALHSPDQHSTLAQGSMLALGGVHTQIGMPTNSACGTHMMGDGAMHKMSAGAHTHDDGTTHTGLLSESDRIAHGHGSMHARISMAVDSACGAHKVNDGATHTDAGAYTHDGSTIQTTPGGESDGIAD